MAGEGAKEINGASRGMHPLRRPFPLAEGGPASPLRRAPHRPVARPHRAPGRTVDEWNLPAHKPDNHWLHCVVGCAAAVGMQGVERIGAAVQGVDRRRPLRLSELPRDLWSSAQM